MQITDNFSNRKGKRKIHQLRVDMTPMVDLGFLLITFFVFTSQISKPKALALNMPKDDGDPALTKCSTSFTIIAAAERIGWYLCEDGNPAAFQHFESDALARLRSALISRRNNIAGFTKATDMVVLIKPVKDCSYKTLVDILDEMTINEITRYAIVEPEESDLRLLEGN